jgi:hypothetical protein
MYQSDLDMPNQLRLAAQNERDELVRFKLHEAADGIVTALRAFRLMPSGDNLTRLQCVWASGVRALGNAGKNVHLHI